MAWYRAGTATFTNGSKNVTGAGTAWAANVRPGDEIIGPDNISREVETVTSDTVLAMVETYAGSTTSGAAYKVKPIQGWNRDVAAQLAALINDYGSIEAALAVVGGNVGIGVASPLSKFHVGGLTRISDPSGSTAVLIDPVTTAGVTSITGIFGGSLGLGAGGVANRVWIDASGKVGFGTSSPGTKLVVENTAAADGLFIRSAAFDLNLTGAANGLLLGANYNNGVAYIVSGGSATNTALVFATAGSAAPAERMRIKSAGQIRLVPLAADPTGGEAGDLYFNSASGKFRGHTGSAWVDLH